ncbi:hypothetical protein GCM10010339_16270 [Streptomyces alanosinicus]|uniref:formate C-acetyltransferase n=1 Tax=Streptomyces alanosinicus TaxID=68171 RepID=A0A918YEE6_9ACTN|nr:pyruvate formate lyase family protein [Streptomyces alanosinicus]GHE00571.1 hypothetical protein GCM10010339_16270 [Streptomyces alanosinicus]
MTATPAEITTSTPAEDPAGTAPATVDAWTGFRSGRWRDTIDVRDFIQSNYTLYEVDASILSGPTERTTRVWEKLLAMFPEEIERSIHDVDVSTPSRIDAFAPGCIDPDLDLIVGLQTDAPLKRAIMPNGGWRMIEGALKAYGPDPAVREIYTKLRKTLNDGVFDAHTSEIRACRSSGIITGLPDAYGRGRIIGDYRRALYGVDRLVAAKKAVMVLLGTEPLTVQLIQEREETSEQIRALEELKSMALSYDYDISGPPAPAAKPSSGCTSPTSAGRASALSVAKLPYGDAEDGVSLTGTITPDALGRTPEERIANLSGVLDGFTASDGFHMNVNVLDEATLQDAMEPPEKYPRLTIKVSGYAVNFIRLTREQLDVINRTFHGSL